MRPLILSYDGGGNDGWTLAFRGNLHALEGHLKKQRTKRRIHRRNSGSGSGDARASVAPLSFTEGLRLALQRLELPKRHSEMNWGNAYASVGAALPEVSRRSCQPLRDRERGFCSGGGENNSSSKKVRLF